MSCRRTEIALSWHGAFCKVALRHQCGQSLYVMSHGLLNVAACVMERELQNFHVSQDFNPF